MRVIPLAAYLDRGNAGGAGAAAPFVPQMSREEELAQARQESESLGREVARCEHEAVLLNERQLFDARLAEARQAWAQEQGQELAKAIGDGLSRIEAAIGEVTARLLEPLIIAEARRTALAELKETLSELLANPETATLRIEGPDDLLAALRQGLGLKNNIAFQVSDRPDIHVETGNTVIETRLGPWAARLREAMG